MKAAAYLLWLVLSGLGAVVVRTPFAVKDLCARVVARLLFDVFRFRRRIVLHNLAAVFPRREQESMAEFRDRSVRLARRNYAHYAHCALEVLERLHWNPQIFARRVRVVGLEHLRAAGQRGGYFYLTAHLGNWELSTIAGILLGVPLTIITKYLRNGFFNALWVRSRERYGLELLDERGAGLGAARAVRRGRALGFILDQHTGPPHGQRAEFLGLPAWCPKGLAILSTRLKVPVLPAYMLRQPNGNFELQIESPLDFPALGDPRFRTESGALNEAGIAYHIGVCNESMEKWIRRYPEQYLWLHKRFKGTLDYRAPLVWSV